MFANPSVPFLCPYFVPFDMNVMHLGTITFYIGTNRAVAPSNPAIIGIYEPMTRLMSLPNGLEFLVCHPLEWHA